MNSRSLSFRIWVMELDMYEYRKFKIINTDDLNMPHTIRKHLYVRG